MDKFDVMDEFAKHPPIDLVGLAEKLGLRVKKTSNLGDNAGKISRENGKGYLIEINAEDPEIRQRFTLAHEIAHYILHEDEIGNGITDNTLYCDLNMPLQKRETQASRLAAQMLMPARLVREEWDKGNRSAAFLAKHFGVTEKAAKVRVDWLGFKDI